MTAPTNLELINAALHELSYVLDYIASERGEGDQLYLDLSRVEEKLETVINRYKTEKIQQI
jgi:hypothetical protein